MEGRRFHPGVDNELRFKAALVLSTCLAILVARRLRIFKRRKQRLPLLPGPPKRWLLGNLFDLLTGPEEWKKFAELGRTYGPITHLGIAGRHIVVVNSFGAAADLLDKRSAIYSDWARFPMVAWERHGEDWRLHRRAIHQHFNENAARDLWPQLARVNAIFLLSTLTSPESFWEHIRWLGGANTMSIRYGMDSRLKDDPYILLGEESVAIAPKACAQGAYLVDMVPFRTATIKGCTPLRAEPFASTIWLPGMGFKRQARTRKMLQLRARDSPYEFAKSQLAAGTACHSMTSHLLASEIDGRAIRKEVIKNSTGVEYFAGADTSVVTMNSFVLAMVKHPHVQRKAQREVDAFLEIQGGRLPQIDDREALPYVEAVMRECMRMYPPLPLGVVHRLMEDDVYEGISIPEDSIVVANAWAMLRDEKYYADPHSFNPERYFGSDDRLDPDVLDPRSICFGFGRRICPGRYFAEAEVWLMMTSVLYCFDITPAKNDHGADIMPNEVMCSGVVRYQSSPLRASRKLPSAFQKFPCIVEPRSAEKADLIAAAAGN
ncbi:cytochrome P450 [Auricularia subglabra TFB-10046 SS5]|nr:cytochrome P450 [Auricularia subglabra TFB-10046 SS5]